MKDLLYTLFLFISAQNLMAQAPASNHDADQGVQGPCYIYAAVAALESLAGGSIDISESYFYSKCVLDGFGTNPFDMIEKTIDHAAEYGALHQNDFYNPSAETSSAHCHGGFADCIFYCILENSDEYNFCEENTNGPIGIGKSDTDNGEAHCEFEEEFFHIIYPSFYYQFSDLEWTKMDSENLEQNVINSISNGQGVILMLEEYSPNNETALDHAIFAYDYFGDGKFRFKDSWPGDAAADRTTELEFSNVISAYTVTGSVTVVSSNTEEECDCVIEDPGVITGPTTLTITGENCDYIINEIISSDNINVRNRNGNLVITPNLNNCEENATIEWPGCDAFDAEFQLDPLPPSPILDIQLLSLQVCPGDIIELNIVDYNNPQNTTYNWSIISGGDLAFEGSGPVAFVEVSQNVPGIPNSGTITIEVTAENPCGESGAFTFNIPLSEDCDKPTGGGQFFMNPNNGESVLNIFPNPAQEILYINSPDGGSTNSVIYDLSGIPILESKELKINISNLNSAIYIIKLISPESGEIQIRRFVKK